MRTKQTMKSSLLKFLVIMFFFILTTHTAFSEMVLNDNVNLEGELFIENSNGGITFYDGSRQTAAAAPSWHQIISAERFEKVLGGEAVLDRETGLVWELNTDVDVTHTWDGAVMHCYGATIGGRKGWRLPTISELLTLVEPLNNDPATQENVFSNIQYGQDDNRNGYWSSTNKLNGSTDAMLVRFSDGLLLTNVKSSDYYVRAVRSAE